MTINPELCGNNKENELYWDGFYAALKDTAVMGLWFEFLATYPRRLNVRSQNCRFDLATLNAHKMISMKVSHKWLCDFFNDARCFDHTDSCYPSNWFDEITFRKIQTKRACVMTKNRTYQYFTLWATRSGQKLKPKKDTFIADLAEVGVCVHRSMMRERKRNVFTFCREDVQHGIARFYNVGDSEVTLSWSFDGDDEFFRLRERSDC